MKVLDSKKHIAELLGSQGQTTVRGLSIATELPEDEVLNQLGELHDEGYIEELGRKSSFIPWKKPKFEKDKVDIDYTYFILSWKGHFFLSKLNG